jgi:isoleucyl-tRNA synthetase
MDRVFAPLPPVPDHPALERGILEVWEQENTFEALREQNRGGAPWSFVDGPITANNPMGVHHCWGRSLKDLFQRYKAMRGHALRYQNGFDCQGLWVEVEVERSLGLNSKPEIEEYGLDLFARACRDRVAHFAEVITEQSKRLGMWMDWDNDYYTFSDTNIEYIWRFLKTVHERGWLYQGHRSMAWCPRCGTSLSQHEQLGTGSYIEVEHPSLFVRFPLRDRGGEALVVWTTTPWTLPANVAAAVNPEAEYGLYGDGDWWAVARKPGETPHRVVRGAELVGLEYEGPFDDLPAQHDVVHRVVAWEDVSLEEGTGVVHIAPGCGAEDFELAREHDLPVLAPVNEAGRFYAGYGALEGRGTDEVADDVVAHLRAAGRLVDAGGIVHRYPVCWRCQTQLIFRVADEWFIAADGIRQQMLAANAEVAWTPAFYSKRMDDWLRNMGDWNISRKRYFGLPLPFYPCTSCGTVHVIGSREELAARATGGMEQLEELHRPWIDNVRIRCDCGAELARIPEVGDAWLDAGIVPFSTLGWENPRWTPGGYATGASHELSGADLPDHAYWDQWFPAAWVSEMREQIRLWFYSQSFMSVTLVGTSPYRAVLAYEKLLDETGREMHRSWGNAIEADEALSSMGADVMRLMFAQAVPSQNIRFGYGPARDVKRRLLTLWNSVSFLVTYANIEGFRPTVADLQEGPSGVDLRPLDRWLLARTQRLVEDATAGYERFWTPQVTRAFEDFVEDLSNWYIRRSRRRFYSYDEAAFRTLWYALVQALRVVAPVMPFLAEALWRELVPAADAAPRSVFLAGWPEVAATLRDEELLAEIDEVRAVVELGRQVRSEENVKNRQPLRRAFVFGAESARRHAEEIAEELRVKEVAFEPGRGEDVLFKPNLPLLGPRLGKELPKVREALAEGRVEELPDGRLRVAGHELSPEEVLVEPVRRPGAATSGVLTVELDLAIDDDLAEEGRVLDLIHTLNNLRKEQGLELTDRIVVTLPRDHESLLAHEEWIKREVLAVRIDLDSAVRIEKAEPVGT